MMDFVATITALLIVCQQYDVSGYTVEDILQRCAPCTSATKQLNVPHPTDCGKYYFCKPSSPTEWKSQICPASTFFDPDRQTCYDSRLATCPILVSGNESLYTNMAILSVPQCAPEVIVVMPTSSPSTTYTPGPRKGKSADTTTILAVLLGVTVVILVVTVLGIFLYRRRQRARRPTNLYRRKLPEASGRKANSRAPPPAAANISYSTRPLLNDRDSCISGVYEMPDMSEDPGYQEIPARDSKEYYSQPPEEEKKGFRPPVNLPTTEYMIPTSGADNHHYSPTDNHVYDKAGPEYLSVNEPYDYCTPESAHPTLSIQRGAELPPTPESPPYYVDPDFNMVTSAAPTPTDEDAYIDPTTQFSHRPDEPPPSPPYYVDPIPTEQTNTSNDAYHTLEPLSKKK